MSTFVLDYPNSLPVRRSANFRWIVVFITGLALVASVILVAASTFANVDSSSSVVAVPVPVAPIADTQVFSSATPAPSLVAIVVPVPEPLAP